MQLPGVEMQMKMIIPNSRIVFAAQRIALHSLSLEVKLPEAGMSEVSAYST